MTKFTTRVELSDGDSKDYDTLHDAMKNQGFSKYITFDGTKRELPTAEYNYEGEITKFDVLRKAETAAKSTGCKYSVLVTTSGGRTCANLKEA